MTSCERYFFCWQNSVGWSKKKKEWNPFALLFWGRVPTIYSLVELLSLGLAIDVVRHISYFYSHIQGILTIPHLLPVFVLQVLTQLTLKEARHSHVMQFPSFCHFSPALKTLPGWEGSWHPQVFLVQVMMASPLSCFAHWHVLQSSLNVSPIL